MTMVEIIELKKNNHVLTKEQIHFIINRYCNNKIPDYQMSAFLMTICFNGLSKQEIFLLKTAIVWLILQAKLCLEMHILEE